MLLFSPVFLMLTGCDDDDNDNSVSVTGPNLNGSWSGTYYFLFGMKPSQSISADIDHRGEVIIIDTSISTGMAARFTGSISSNGQMTLTDNYDGETWTTFFGAASTGKVVIADYIWDDDIGAAEDMAIISLTR